MFIKQIDSLDNILLTFLRGTKCSIIYYFESLTVFKVIVKLMQNLLSILSFNQLIFFYN